MPINNNGRFNYNADSVRRNAPNGSGVYVLYSQREWVYVGESNDIQRRLLEHLAEQGTCIVRHAPTAFAYELWPLNQRVARQNQLIAELRPSCNQMFG